MKTTTPTSFGHVLMVIIVLFVLWTAFTTDTSSASAPEAQKSSENLPSAEAADYGRVCARHERHSRYPVASNHASPMSNGDIYVVIQHTDGTIAHCVFSGGQVVDGGEGLY